MYKGITKIILILLFNFILGATPFQIRGCLNCPGSPIEEKISVIYYYEESNVECIKTIKLLQTLASHYGELEIKMENIKDSTTRDQLLYLFSIYRKSQEVKIPTVFIGNQLFLVGYEEIRKGLFKDVIPSLEREYPKTFRGEIKKIFISLRIFILNFSESFLIPTIIMAGLIDSINPCAISILIFLISFMGRIQGLRENLLPIGGSFILGSFLAYFAIGLGVLKFVNSQFIIRIYNFLYIIFGLLTIILGILSILDAYYAKRYEIDKIKLQLPMKIKKLSHYFIRQISYKSILLTSSFTFLIGFLMSLLEFPCSGQIYIPTITLIGNPLNKNDSLLLLALYNLMFTLPLILIVLVSSCYLSSSKIANFISKNLFRIKILTALLLFALGTYMLLLV